LTNGVSISVSQLCKRYDGKTILDGVSLITNVQSQVQQVIAKESYQGLIKRMREKLAES